MKGAKIISFSIFKGGTGKTTSAVNAATGLTQAGHRVLLTDLDQQASATRHLGIDPEPLSPTFYDVYVRNVPISLMVVCSSTIILNFDQFCPFVYSVDSPITISNGGVGVGQTSNVMEELIRIGGRVFIQLGAAGAIQENINLGDIIIPTGSVRDEGLTDYYAPKQYPAVADYRIVRALAEAAAEEKYRFHTGIIRTTEGFYPSQRVEEYVKTYHDLGVLGVEQEVSGILTICSTSGCFAGACLMVIGNLVKGQHYMKGDEYEHLDRVWFEQIKVIFKAMQYLRKDNFPGTTE